MFQESIKNQISLYPPRQKANKANSYQYFGFNIQYRLFAGYSPERINPGDKLHTVEKFLKVTSGSTPEIGFKVDDLYKLVITAGTHLAPSIKVAEAAKVIKNSQQDINIAFVNE